MEGGRRVEAESPVRGLGFAGKKRDGCLTGKPGEVIEDVGYKGDLPAMG